jgi:hypothetical protein
MRITYTAVNSDWLATLGQVQSMANLSFEAVYFALNGLRASISSFRLIG